jgi:hypothetical protein
VEIVKAAFESEVVDPQEIFDGLTPVAGADADPRGLNDSVGANLHSADQALAAPPQSGEHDAASTDELQGQPTFHEEEPDPRHALEKSGLADDAQEYATNGLVRCDDCGVMYTVDALITRSKTPGRDWFRLCANCERERFTAPSET